MLMIQDKQTQIVERKLKEKDQVRISRGSETHIGCIDMVIPGDDKTTYIMHTKDYLIHIYLDRVSHDHMTYKDYMSFTFYKPTGITNHTGDECRIERMISSSNNCDAFVNKDLLLVTSEQVTNNVERPLTIEDELKYINDGCTYDILYISPHDNMIIKERKSGEERVVNKKDRQLQIALGIRKA